MPQTFFLDEATLANQRLLDEQAEAFEEYFETVLKPLEELLDKKLEEMI